MLQGNHQHTDGERNEGVCCKVQNKPLVSSHFILDFPEGWRWRVLTDWSSDGLPRFLVAASPGLPWMGQQHCVLQGNLMMTESVSVSGHVQVLATVGPGLRVTEKSALQGKTDISRCYLVGRQMTLWVQWWHSLGLVIRDTFRVICPTFSFQQASIKKNMAKKL